MITCPLTGSTRIKVLYEQKSVPLIQNKAYSTKKKAKRAPCADVVIAQSLDNGFVFNGHFDSSSIDYDPDYQNEQSNSVYFQKHLKHVIEIMEKNHLLDGKVVEIGCGKAYFMDMLLKMGVNIMGFDPIYEGKSTKVVKDFFSSSYSEVGADCIILRHTLEHISRPLDFIKTVADANGYKGKIYIEVPTFDWIMQHNATEDIFYEHCNYFTLRTLKMLFKKSVGGHFFNGQYIYVIADLADVRDEIRKRVVVPYEVSFRERLQKYKKMINGRTSVAIWGAGGKGSTFLNIVDKQGNKITCAVDSNPKKQHQYIGGTGHYVIQPDELGGYGIKHVIVMNSNYLEEIRAITQPLGIHLLTLD